MGEVIQFVPGITGREIAARQAEIDSEWNRLQSESMQSLGAKIIKRIDEYVAPDGDCA
jgi:hypothetical protein